MFSHVQDQILGKQISSTQEGLWSINNQNYLLPDLLQQSQISDSSVNTPKVPLTSQEPQNKSVNKVWDKFIDWMNCTTTSLQPVEAWVWVSFEFIYPVSYKGKIFHHIPSFIQKMYFEGLIRKLKLPTLLRCSTFLSFSLHFTQARRACTLCSFSCNISNTACSSAFNDRLWIAFHPSIRWQCTRHAPVADETAGSEKHIRRFFWGPVSSLQCSAWSRILTQLPAQASSCHSICTIYLLL